MTSLNLLIQLKGGNKMADNKEEQKKKKGATKGDPVASIEY